MNLQSYPPVINPELVAYWFFRLNGCTTISNFIVHPDHGSTSQRTDVDVLAVRFPFRTELLTSSEPMQDHEVFNSESKIDIVFAEVKHGKCRLNGPWTNPPDENIHRVLFALGAFESNHVSEVAHALYHEGHYINDLFRVRLIAIGMIKNAEIFPDAVQLTWDDLIIFIYKRFTSYRTQKAHHNQWDPIGRTLYQIAIHHSLEEYIVIIKEYMQNYVDKKNRSLRALARGKND